jgi:predicted DCC family thiol-disulfide oxidoreductase YuxK
LIVVAYDGTCGLCHGFVRFLLRHDVSGALLFAASDSDAGGRIFAASGQNPNDPGAMIVLVGDTSKAGAEAAIAAIVGLGGAWRLAGIMYAVPPFIRSAVYRWVAARRITWFGRASGCPVADPNRAGRFLP